MTGVEIISRNLSNNTYMSSSRRLRLKSSWYTWTYGWFNICIWAKNKWKITHSIASHKKQLIMFINYVQKEKLYATNHNNRYWKKSVQIFQTVIYSRSKCGSQSNPNQIKLWLNVIRLRKFQVPYIPTEKS